MPIWIKICGIQDVEMARGVAALGPDAIGLNFYGGSPRVIAPEAASEIVAGLPRSVIPVGVFVNHAPSEVQAICGRVGISTVQIHGNEPADVLGQLSGLNIIRAFRVREESIEAVGASIERIQAAGARLTACLVDAHVTGVYGGTGQRPPWQVLADGWDRTAWPPLILAGGLTPENVAEGVRTVRPWGVDVASGVESAPGVKDLDRVARFISAARAAAVE